MALANSGSGPKEDRTRFFRLGMVIIDELTAILRDLLHQEIDPNDIFNKVTQKSVTGLKAHQWHLLSTAKTDGYQKFDITLLYSLLRNVCPYIQSPTQKWGVLQMPPQSEITVGDDIERIRLIRNNVLGHIPKAGIPEKEFLDYWSIIFGICNRMKTLMNKDYVKQLLEMKECPIDTDTQSKCMEIIKGLTEEVLTSKENIEIEAKGVKKRTFVETLIGVSISTLNEMVKAVHAMTSESDINQIYASIEQFLKANKNDIKNLDLKNLFNKLKEKIKQYAKLPEINRIRILAQFLEFVLKLQKEYGACLESSSGSLVLLLTFSSKSGYDFYKRDLENGKIGLLILQLFEQPPFLSSFGLMVEDIVVHLNGRRLTQTTTVHDLTKPTFSNICVTEDSKKSDMHFLSTRQILPFKPLLDAPRVVSEINTAYGTSYNELGDITCFTDDKIWTCGYNCDKIRLYSIQGELLETVHSNYKDEPSDIAVTRTGALRYINFRDRSINIICNSNVQKLVTFHGWRPRGMCSSCSDTFLVVMDSDDYKQTKVVRYLGAMEKQTIQWVDEDKTTSLYSSGGNKYICENRNLDICVADSFARAVVVVNQSGMFRFEYTGSSLAHETFWPNGITTDSQGCILTSDFTNNCVHILHQDGECLRKINCGLYLPSGLSVDSNDNLFVGEWTTGNLKKIQYYE